MKKITYLKDSFSFFFKHSQQNIEKSHLNFFRLRNKKLSRQVIAPVQLKHYNFGPEHFGLKKLPLQHSFTAAISLDFIFG